MNLRSATVIIAGITALVSLLFMAGGLKDAAAGMMGFIPARLTGTLVLEGAVPAMLTPFSCTLVHGGVIHLFFNIFMLLVCGIALERVLGPGAVVAIYLASAVVSALAQWAFDPAGVVPVIGASGAVSGVIGAYALSFGRPKRLSGSPAANRLVHIIWLALAWTALQIAVGFAAGAEGVLLATPAHVGGFLTGLLLQRPLLLWRYRKA